MRYVIGIDLGTTNSCAAYIDTDTHTNPRLTIQQLSIPQLTHPNQIQNKNILPSTLYLAADYEWNSGALDLPWAKDRDYFVGSYALEHGVKVPTRLIQSAKSWLCHTAANRKDKTLPVESAEEARRMSPVEASARYLAHIKDAWNHTIAKKTPELEFEEQEIILTVPASFDEVSRSLTIEAAHLAGIRHLTLIEEPQAAFYSWISQNKEHFSQFTTGEIILVCDVGGGTTDFSLIEVIDKDGIIGFQRIAVGNHLLLGGDNFDRTLAHYLEKKITQELSLDQWLQLIHQSRVIKEKLLDEKHTQQTEKVVIQGKGSSVIQGSITLTVDKQEILDLILKGFFGQYPWEEAVNIKKTSGLKSLGLPYEEEPSITKHLAYFLKQHMKKAPQYVLFNGGTMKPAIFQNSIVDSLKNWFSLTPKVLSTFSLDLAVARGAAYYGSVKRGLGVKIAGGSPRTFYLELDIKENETVSKKLLTLVPKGSDEGYTYEPEHNFLATSNTPVVFKIYTSHTRLGDHQGDFVQLDEDNFQSLPFVQTLLRYGKNQTEKIPVKLVVQLTPLGTLELTLRSARTQHKWKLEFQLQAASGQEIAHQSAGKERFDELIDEEYLLRAKEVLVDIFKNRKIAPKDAFKELEKVLNKSRDEWAPSILRGLWSILMDVSPFRKGSAEIEARWWNLVGYFLRPGYGYPLDDFKIKDLWKIILSDVKNKSSEVTIQQWICFRRVAGGFNKGQQEQLSKEIMNSIMTKKGTIIEFKNKNEIYQYSEQVRLLAAMELLDMTTKTRIGNALLQKILAGKAIPNDYWSLARIGARHLINASVSNVVNRNVVSEWLDSLIKSRVVIDENVFHVFSQLGRKTKQRELNVSQDVVKASLDYFKESSYLIDLEEQLTKELELSSEEQEYLLGDKLPPGLLLEY